MLRVPVMTDQVRPPRASDDRPAPSADRRKALLKLGLAVGAAYFAPTVLSIDRSARAQGPSCIKNPKKC
jgi:hypothetical protein